MNHLPQFWAVKIDREHPLWEKFYEEIMQFYNISNTCHWTHVGYDGSSKSGYNMATGVDKFCRSVKEITLEQFFGEPQYEIY